MNFQPPRRSNHQSDSQVPVASHDANHDANTLIELFNGVFASYQTCLLGGATEPLYQPRALPGEKHCIHFTHDYFASALHEIAHWCLAGEHRRQQVDYGYWYLPDGRNAKQQQRFENVETKPQAMEWIFCCAADYSFRLSIDNLNGSASASEQFKNQVWQQAQRYCSHGLPERGGVFALALQQHFKGGEFLNPNRYQIETLK